MYKVKTAAGLPPGGSGFCSGLTGWSWSSGTWAEEQFVAQIHKMPTAITGSGATGSEPSKATRLRPRPHYCVFV